LIDTAMKSARPQLPGLEQCLERFKSSLAAALAAIALTNVSLAAALAVMALTACGVPAETAPASSSLAQGVQQILHASESPRAPVTASAVSSLSHQGNHP
jgi:hypothetical protein